MHVYTYAQEFGKQEDRHTTTGVGEHLQNTLCIANIQSGHRSGICLEKLVCIANIHIDDPD